MNLLKLICAFIEATAWAYLACAVYMVLGKPALVGIDTRLQGAFYLFLFAVLLYVSHNPGIWILNKGLGIFYAFGAVGSFIGYPQVWMAYWKKDPEKGSDAAQIGMANWDLPLAVAFLYLT